MVLARVQGALSLKHATDEIQRLAKHLENMSHFGVGAVVAVNRFAQDSDEEIAIIKRFCESVGSPCVDTQVWAKGGAGAEELAHAVVDVVEKAEGRYSPLYDWASPVEDKIKTIATKIYGAKAIDYMPKAKADLRKIKRLNLDNLPVCIAKTQKSLSDNPALLGRPKDFVVTVREIEIAAGAGFLIPITGEIMRMPGLPAHPAAEKIDIDTDGHITGLF